MLDVKDLVDLIGRKKSGKVIVVFDGVEYCVCGGIRARNKTLILTVDPLDEIDESGVSSEDFV